MEFKSLLITLVIIISLGMVVSSKELVFNTGNNQDIRISIDLINSSGLWNETGTTLVPHTATNGVRLPNIANCDADAEKLETDSTGEVVCGTNPGGSGDTSSTDDFDGGNLSAYSSDNITITDGGKISFNMTCEQITGSSELCDGSDATGAGDDPNKYGQLNFTTDYDERTDRWLLLNYSNEYGNSGFGNNNFSVRYYAITDRFGNSNFTTLYYGIDDRFDNENWTARFLLRLPELWTKSNASSYYDSRTDRFQITNGTSLVVGGEVSGTVGSITLSDTALDNQYVQLENQFKEENLSNLGTININTSGKINATRFGGKLDCSLIDGGTDGNFCVDADSGGGGGSNIVVWIDKGTYIVPNGSIASDVNINGTLNVSGKLNASIVNASRIGGKIDCSEIDGGTDGDFCSDATGASDDPDKYKQLNFTTDYDERTDRYGKLNYSTEYGTSGFKILNFTTNYYAITNRFGNLNFSTLYASITSRYGKGNYSTEYGSTGYKKLNFTNNYDSRTDRFTIGNWTTRFNLRLPELYKKTNFTNNYDSRTDRFKNSNATALMTDANIPNDLTIQSTKTITTTLNISATGSGNSSIGNGRLIDYNSSCWGIRRGTTGGGLFSCV